MFRRFIIAAIAVIAPLFSSPHSAVAAETVRIGWLRAPNDLTLARAHGSLEKALAPLGITVTWVGPFTAAAPAFEALNANAIDITVGSSTAAISGLAARMPLVIFAYQKMSPASEGILVKRGSPIKTLADLKGKSVAVNRGGTGEYLLVRALTTHNIDPASVKRVYLSPPDSAAAFATDHVDAWATWDPFVSLALKSYDAEMLMDGAGLRSENAVVMVANRDYADKKRAALQTIFATLEAENAWSVEHPAAAGAIWVDSMGLPATIASVLGANNAVPTHAVTAQDAAQISDIADWYVTEGIIPTKPDVGAGTIQLKE
jgi:sulfonate transport system substrate-binding protein